MKFTEKDMILTH